MKPDPLHLLRRYQEPRRPVAAGLGEEMVSFFKQSVQKRQKKLGAVAAAWEQLVPTTLSRHCSLEGLYRGTLAVLVDSPSHLYELKQLLKAGIEEQLKLACPGAGLRKITLKPGRWYESSQEGEKKARFEK